MPTMPMRASRVSEAALPSVPRSVADPISSNVACVDATVNLLWAAKEAGVRRVVYAASSSAYGDTPTLPKHEQMLPNPISPYAVAKLTGEYYMRSFARVYGLETVSLRYFNVFGPYQDPTSQYSGVLAVFCRKMLAGEQPTIYGDGETSRDFTFIQNTVEANLLAASAPAEKVAGRVMNVATGVRVTLNEVVEVLRGITGYDGPVATLMSGLGISSIRWRMFRWRRSCWGIGRAWAFGRGWSGQWRGIERQGIGSRE
jgi:UDP-glucose 4-epimerase